MNSRANFIVNCGAHSSANLGTANTGTDNASVSQSSVLPANQWQALKSQGLKSQGLKNQAIAFLMSVGCLAVLLVSLMASLFASPSYAVVELERLSSEVLQTRYESLIEELRCPKCQNQSLAGSDSPIAADLRREVRVMLEGGRSDQEIRDFLVLRYGEFVLYNPPMSGVTLWVWVIPVVLFLCGVFSAVLAVRKAMKTSDGNAVQDEDRLVDTVQSDDAVQRDHSSPQPSQNEESK